MFRAIKSGAKQAYKVLFESEMDRIEKEVKNLGATFAVEKNKSIAFKTIIQAYLKEKNFDSKENNATRLRQINPNPKLSLSGAIQLWKTVDKNNIHVKKSDILTHQKDSAFDFFMPKVLQELIAEYAEDDLFANNMSLCHRVIDLIKNDPGYNFSYQLTNEFYCFLCKKLCQAFGIDEHARRYQREMNSIMRAGNVIPVNEEIGTSRLKMLKEFFSAIPRPNFANGPR